MKRLQPLEGDFTVAAVSGHLEPPEVLDSRLRAGVRPVEGEPFLQAMRSLPGAVVLVTTRVDGRPWGLTISSCCSLTLDPPQVLVSLRSDTTSCRAITAEGRFGISVLTEEQEYLARLGAAPDVAKFVDDHCSRDSDDTIGPAPAIADALSHLECEVARLIRVETHTLIIGLVTAVVADERRLGTVSPLVYVNRKFSSVEHIEEEVRNHG